MRLAAATLCLLAVACTAKQSEPPAPKPSARNLVIITIDTLRADHVGVYGYKAAHTPTLDRLAHDGVLFTHAYATAPITLTSHASLMTGDNRATAQAVATALGIPPSDVHSELLPTEKRDLVRRLESQGRVVAMAGDGINDAPALAAATVGIAMGTGTDIAIESAGITLVKGDLRGILRARQLSRATMRNIRQNLFLAFIYNAVGVPVAAGALYPFLGLLISPIWASAAMTFSSVSVILNALRLRHTEL